MRARDLENAAVAPERQCVDAEGNAEHRWRAHWDSDDSGRWQYVECEVCGEINDEADPADFDDDEGL